jgi:uncharacterized membrane-anchored protein YitT (DUF2179 family)
VQGLDGALPVEKKGQRHGPSPAALISAGAHMLLGVLVCGFALKGFLIPNHFFDGGVTGVSLLIHEFYGIPVAYIIVLVNLPFVILSMRLVSLRFAIRTICCIAGLGLCLLLVPYPQVTEDRLLVAVFGGVFMGLGVGLAMRGGAALDGVEVLAVYTRKHISFTVSEIVLAINIVIFTMAAIHLGVETALYSMLTYYAASRTTNFVVEGLEEYTSVTIVSAHSGPIKEKLVKDFGRGITVYKGERGFLRDSFEVSYPCDIIQTVVTRLEVSRLKGMIYAIDPKAFVVTARAKEALGGVLKRQGAH